MSIYLPPHFEQTDPAQVADLIAAFPLATIVTSSGGELVANHIPMQFSSAPGESGSLQGHIARNNDLWRMDVTGLESLAIFQSPDAYISPNWYPGKAEHHRVVPTWNYAVVHVYGNLVFHDDEKWLRGVIGKLTKSSEASQPQPWYMGEAPRDFLKEQLGMIVGVELQITRIIAKWKMSQNRTETDRSGVIAALETTASPTARWIAETIARNGPD
jgi:transcriptional regulator